MTRIEIPTTIERGFIFHKHMDEQKELDRFGIQTQSESKQFNVAPHDDVTLAINGVIALQMTSDDYMTYQLKRWKNFKRG